MATTAHTIPNCFIYKDFREKIVERLITFELVLLITFKFLNGLAKYSLKFVLLSLSKYMKHKILIFNTIKTIDAFWLAVCFLYHE